MGNKCFFSFSPLSIFRASLLLADGAMTFNKITSKRVFERRQQPTTQNKNKKTSGTFSVAGAKIQVYS